MNQINQTTIEQLTHQSANRGPVIVNRLTGAQIVFDDKRNTVSLHFPKLVGEFRNKFKTLEIKYNEATDLYDLQGYRINSNTFQVVTRFVEEGVYGDQLKSIVEQKTGLYLSLS